MAAYELGQISALLSKNPKNKNKGRKGGKLEKVFDETGGKSYVEFVKRDSLSNKVCGRLIRKYEKKTNKSGSSLACPKTSLSKIKNDSIQLLEMKFENKRVLNDLETAETVCDQNLKGHESKSPLSNKVIATLKAHVTPSKSQCKVMKRKGDAMEAGVKKKTKHMPEMQLNHAVVDSTNNEILQIDPSHKIKRNKYRNQVVEAVPQQLADDPDHKVKKNKCGAKVLLDMEDKNSESYPISHLLHASPSYENKKNKKKNQMHATSTQGLVNDTNSNFKRNKHNAKWSDSKDVKSRNSVVSQFSQASPSWNSKKKKKENRLEEIPSQGLAGKTNHEIKKNKHKVKKWSNKEDVDSRSSVVSQVLQVSPSYKSKKNKNKNRMKLISSQDLADDSKCEQEENRCQTKMWSNTEDVDSRSGTECGRISDDESSDNGIKCRENIGKLKVSSSFLRNRKQMDRNESHVVEEECGRISNDESSDEHDEDYVPLSTGRLRGFEGREDNDERRRRTVFVGNLPMSFNTKKLKALFQPFGDIESARTRSLISEKESLPKKLAYIRKKYHQTCYSLNGFVVFKSYQDALNALSLNGTVIKNHHIRVDLVSNSKTHDCKRSVFVGNLPFDVNDEKLWSGFAECGSITAVRVVKDNETGVGKGFGFVLFQDKNSVDEALKLNEKEMFGRCVRVQVVENKYKNNSKFSKKSSSGVKLARKRKQNNEPFEKKVSKKKQLKKRKSLQLKKKISSILTNK